MSLRSLLGSDESEDDGTPQIGLDADTLFQILSNERRRLAIRILNDFDSSKGIQLGDLSDMVAAQEQGTTVDRLSTDQKKRVYVSLYQNHIPRLVNRDLARQPQDDGTVEATQKTQAVSDYLGHSAGEWGVEL